MSHYLSLSARKTNTARFFKRRTQRTSVKRVILLVLLSTLIIAAAGALENNTTNTTLGVTPTVETSQNTLGTEEPAQMPGNTLLLYSLLCTIAVLVLIVGSLVIGITKKHELPATTAALLREEAPYFEHDTSVELSEIRDQEILPTKVQTAPQNSSSQRMFVHYPSINEARAYIQKLRDRGYSDSQIRDHFTLHGWNDQNIAIAIRH